MTLLTESPKLAEPEDDARFLRTEFLERVAHEIRGPIGVTMGALDELELELSTDSATDLARVAAMLAMARRGVRKVLRTADRLSRAAQIESGDVAIVKTSTDLRAIVERSVQDASTTEGRARIQVTTELPDSPCMTGVDEGWMGAALSELVGHSIRAARRSVRVAIDHGAGRFRISVTDDRVVAPEPLRPRFSRDAPRRDVGLDLALVHDVARLHGWDLELDDHRAATSQDGAAQGVTTRLLVEPSTR